MPMRDVGRKPQVADLRLEEDLGLGIAVDEEDPARIPGPARSLARRKMTEPGEQLALVRVRREAADRSDLASDRADLAVQLDLAGARLQMRPSVPSPW